MLYVLRQPEQWAMQGPYLLCNTSIFIFILKLAFSLVYTYHGDDDYFLWTLILYGRGKIICLRLNYVQSKNFCKAIASKIEAKNIFIQI